LNLLQVFRFALRDPPADGATATVAGLSCTGLFRLQATRVACLASSLLRLETSQRSDHLGEISVSLASAVRPLPPAGLAHSSKAMSPVARAAGWSSAHGATADDVDDRQQDGGALRR
jgi:hypothetical protein